MNDDIDIDQSTEQDGNGKEGAGRQQGNEAAKRRVQLRDAEAQRDALQQRLDAVQRREVLRAASERLSDGEDLLRDVAVADLLDDEGNIDDGKVAAAVETLLEQSPHYERGHGTKDLELSNRQPKLRNNFIPTEVEEAPSWSGLLSNRG